MRRLAVQPRRLAHTRAVAAKAQEISWVTGVEGDVELLMAGAWLHDIGYAGELAVTGFHPLDGARYLQAAGVPGRLTSLVARHSCAIVEARLRGLGGEVGGFPDESGPVRDALWYCDMTTSPDGRSVTLDERLHEIQRRYGSGIVSAFTEEAWPYLRGAIERTEGRLREVEHDRQL